MESSMESSNKPRRKIVLYFDPEEWERELHSPMTDAVLEDIGKDINEFCSHILSYEAWKVE